MKLTEVPFDAKKPLIVRREFTVNGHPQYVGDTFNWRQLSLAERKVKQLYDTRKIIHPDSKTFDVPEKRKTGVQQYIDAIGNKPKQEQPKDQTVLSHNTQDEPQDDLMNMTMPELREVADEIGAPYKVSKAQQREEIRKKRGE